MAPAPKQIVEAALQFGPTEREHIAHELLEIIGESSSAELSPGWEAEIQRRRRKIEAGEATCVI
jgi:hypothetical protein